MLRHLCKKSLVSSRVSLTRRLNNVRQSSTVPTPEAIIEESQTLRASVQVLNDVSAAILI